MNYRHIYMIIITKAKEEMQLGIRCKSNGNYYEKHHILPKSLFPLWEYRRSNIVLLTAREHYFCHELLIKIYPSRSMNYALWFLSNSKYHKVSSRQYERAKLLNWKNSLGESNPNFGNKWNDEQKLAASVKTKNRIAAFGNPMKDKYHSEDFKRKMRAAKSGRHFYTNGVETICVFDDNVPDGFYKGHTSDFLPKTKEGKKAKSERGKNMKHDVNIGKKWFHNKTGKNVLAFECPEGFMKGKYMSEEKLSEMKKKNSEAHKGKPSWNKGVHYSLPKRPGLHWYTNGKINTRAKECPDGFWFGRTYQKELN